MKKLLKKKTNKSKEHQTGGTEKKRLPSLSIRCNSVSEKKMLQVLFEFFLLL